MHQRARVLLPVCLSVSRMYALVVDQATYTAILVDSNIQMQAVFHTSTTLAGRCCQWCASALARSERQNHFLWTPNA